MPVTLSITDMLSLSAIVNCWTWHRHHDIDAVAAIASRNIRPLSGAGTMSQHHTSQRNSVALALFLISLGFQYFYGERAAAVWLMSLGIVLPSPAMDTQYSTVYTLPRVTHSTDVRVTSNVQRYIPPVFYGLSAEGKRQDHYFG
jgi:hypothetical protein